MFNFSSNKTFCWTQNNCFQLVCFLKIKGEKWFRLTWNAFFCYSTAASYLILMYLHGATLTCSFSLVLCLLRFMHSSCQFTASLSLFLPQLSWQRRAGQGRGWVDILSMSGLDLKHAALVLNTLPSCFHSACAKPRNEVTKLPWGHHPPLFSSTPETDI